jgi:hypothetical protein
VLIYEKLDDVRVQLEEFPRQSLRKLASQARMSHSSAQRTVNKLNLRPYCIHVIHKLKGTEKAKRLQYCRWFRAFVEDPYLFHEMPLQPGKSRRQVVGPTFFEETDDGNVFRGYDLHTVHFSPSSGWPWLLASARRRCVSQANETMTFLREFFSDHLISEDSWPSRSPDLSPDFTLGLP